MEAYTSFAQVYDMFMDNVPYDEWCAYLHGLLQEQGIASGSVVDLGCGTGQITRRLAKEGYQMTGVDLSADMLSIAMQQQETEPILYLQQDMCELELYEAVDAMVSICDSMNYLLQEEELCQTFSRVKRYLKPNGIFIFDMNTMHKYRDVIGETTISENRDIGSFIWENYYEEQEQINEYDLTLFIEETEGLFRRFEEVHYQRAYEQETVQKCLQEAGLTVLAVYDAFTHNPATKESERIYFICKNCE